MQFRFYDPTKASMNLIALNFITKANLLFNYIVQFFTINGCAI